MIRDSLEMKTLPYKVIHNSIGNQIIMEPKNVQIKIHQTPALLGSDAQHSTTLHHFQPTTSGDLYLTSVVSRHSPHIVMHCRQYWNWISGHIYSREYLCSLRDSRQPSGEGLRGQMAQLEVNVVLLFPTSSEAEGNPSTDRHSKSGCTHLPSLISRVMERETTSLEAKSLAVGAYRSMNRSPSLLMR